MIPLKDDNPTKSFPFVTIALIVCNVVVFAYQVSLGNASENFIMEFAAVPYEIVNMIDVNPLTSVPIPATPFTSMFIHANLLHLGGNMLYLWIFGNNIEDRLGYFRFIVFYILCGIIATGTHIFNAPQSTIPLVGASGAIAGVLGAYLLLYPKANVHTLIFIVIFIKVIKVPAILLLSFWFLIQVLNSGGAGGGVAWFAHIGGFVAGFFLVKLFIKNKKG